jgi:hypothetical protein
MKMSFSQNIIIDLFVPEKVIITDKLVSWNFLTGANKMSLKGALLYNFIALIFFGSFCQYLQLFNHNYTGFLILFVAWVLLSSFFYLIKLESLRQKLINYLK